MRYQRTPIDELISGACCEVKSFLRGCEEGLTPEAVNHLIEETAYRCIMYETERHAISQDGMIFREMLYTYDWKLVSIHSPYEERFALLPSCPPFNTTNGFRRCMGHLMGKIVGGITGELREPPRDGMEIFAVAAPGTSSQPLQLLSQLIFDVEDLGQGEDSLHSEDSLHVAVKDDDA